MNFTEINSYLEKISNSEVILSNFNSVSFEGLQNYISDKKNIRLINKFFEAIDLKVNGRIFLSSFMIYLHTNDNDKDDELFYYQRSYYYMEKF